MSSTVRSSYWGPNTQFATKTFPEQRALAEQRGWKVDGQEETCPTTGRKHYQFWVKTPQVRMSEVKKVFGGAHIEPARNVKAVQKYCAKEETRSGALPQASDKYPTQDKLFDLFARRMHRALQGGAKFPSNGDKWLVHFDLCCEELIRDGYRVESLAVNPAVRSAIKKFGGAIYERHISAKLAEEDESSCAGDSQPDRQVEILSLPVCTNIDASRRKIFQSQDSQGGSSHDGSSSASEDIQDDFSSSDAGHSESTGSDRSEASDLTGYSE